MADNKKKKTVVEEEVVISDVAYEETSYEVLIKIRRAVYVVIAILLVNTILIGSLMNNGASATNNGGETVQTDYDISMFNEIDADQFVELFSKEGVSIITMGRDDCSFCVQFLPTLQQSVDEYDYTLNYYDINKLNDEAADKIKALSDFLEENLGVTPVLIAVKDGIVVDSIVGASDYENLTSLLEKQGISKK